MLRALAVGYVNEVAHHEGPQFAELEQHPQLGGALLAVTLVNRACRVVHYSAIFILRLMYVLESQHPNNVGVLDALCQRVLHRHVSFRLDQLAIIHHLSRPSSLRGSTCTTAQYPNGTFFAQE